MNQRSKLKADRTTENASRAPRGSAPRPGGNLHDPVAVAARHELISIEAYLRAAQRGFEPGKELDDWLAAEAHVESQLREGPGEGDRA